VPILIPIVSLTACEEGVGIHLHASAVVHHGLGILMAGWPHCGENCRAFGIRFNGGRVCRRRMGSSEQQR